MRAMLYMVIEHFRQGRAPEVYHRLRERAQMGLFEVIETEVEALLRGWAVNWHDLMDFEIVPVRTFAEAAAAMASAP